MALFDGSVEQFMKWDLFELRLAYQKRNNDFQIRRKAFSQLNRQEFIETIGIELEQINKPAERVLVVSWQFT